MKKNKKDKTAVKDSGIRPQDLDESVLDESEDDQDGYNVQFMKLVTGEEIVALVDVMMTFETHNNEPQTTFMLSYPMEVVNMALNGDHTVLFKPWINQVLVNHSPIPIKERVVMTNVAMKGSLKANYLRYVAARQMEQTTESKIEPEATFH